jgi:sialate O-acetylesterase
LSQTHGAGFGIPFGKALADRQGIKVGLISWAQGGTIIERWLPKFKRRSASLAQTLYEAMLERLRRTSEQAGFTFKEVLFFKGVLRHQDEWDADTLKAKEHAQHCGSSGSGTACVWPHKSPPLKPYELSQPLDGVGLEI